MNRIPGSVLVPSSALLVAFTVVLGLGTAFGEPAAPDERAAPNPAAVAPPTTVAAATTPPPASPTAPPTAPPTVPPPAATTPGPAAITSTPATATGGPARGDATPGGVGAEPPNRSVVVTVEAADGVPLTDVRVETLDAARRTGSPTTEVTAGMRLSVRSDEIVCFTLGPGRRQLRSAAPAVAPPPDRTACFAPAGRPTMTVRIEAS